MASRKLLNLAREESSSTGTNDLVLTGAVANHLTFAVAGATTGMKLSYSLFNGANSEVGEGTYSSTGPTLTRDTVIRSTNGGAKISLAGAVEVACVGLAEDIDVSTFTTETAAALADLAWIYDASAADKRGMTIENILKVVNLLTADAVPDHAADYVLTYDASASGVKKVLLSHLAVPQGTKMMFVQTAAPTGWTKDTDQNDKALRIVSGTPSTGGSSPFSTVFGKVATDTVTLSTNELPAHAHGPPAGQTYYYFYDPSDASQWGSDGTGLRFGWTGATGSSGNNSAFAHGMDIRVQYVDVIKATKN